MARAKTVLAPAPAASPLRAMRGTPYHAKYYANEITRMAPGGDADRLAMSLFDACVDLNPHQIEAGLFALRSPLSKGVILADEVGLGKTIEAGLVLTQYWAERRRRLLIICPASIRKQWSFELTTKFNLPNRVLDAVSYRDVKKRGRNPFEGKNVVIVSYHFASKMKDELAKVFWDLVVLDEAHRLRNVHTKSAKMAQNIKDCLGDCRKLLLTATPLQNSLLELYGLASFVDDRLFGDKRSFQAQYRGDDADLQDLRARMAPFVWRTLRKDVQEYIRFTERIPMTEKFDPAQPEIELYEKVSEFIQRPDTYALPHRQKQLTGMVMRKILASSSEALVGTLTAIRARLQAQLAKQEPAQPLADLIEDEVLDEEEVEELDEESDDGPAEAPPIVLDEGKLRAEIAELTLFIELASSIKVDSKSNALLKGLQQGFAKMSELGGSRKALIFTESRRTQRYLKAFLETNGYAGQIVLFNGTNNDPQQAAVYKTWVEANAGTGRVSGSKGIDMRTALMEHFRDQATIMIATESAAEGVNLQFCSLVINYDLPWNPQRIEQRVGRCHRYGQKHDVVVINFLNQKNQADVRVFELLEHKFRLFQGVFGSSDDVLGAIGSGVDFEKRVFDIYQQCRTPKEINSAFDTLRKELEEQIADRMVKTRQLLIENFDQEVHHRVKINLPDTQSQLDQVEHHFWLTTKVVLDGRAEFDDANLTFDLHTPPDGHKDGTYRLIRKNQQDEPEAGDFLYRLSHPLGEYVLDAAKSFPTGPAVVTFDLSGHPTKVTVLNEYRGKKGWLTLRKLTVSAFTDEEHIIFNGTDEEGNPLEPEVLEKLLMVAGTDVKPKDAIPDEVRQELDGNVDQQVSAKLTEVLEHNEAHFSEEQDRIERWARDRILSAEKELQEEKERADDYARQARVAKNLQARLALMKKQQAAEANLRTHQQKIWDAQDEIRRVRNGLIDELAARLKQKTDVKELFTIAWKVV